MPYGVAVKIAQEEPRALKIAQEEPRALYTHCYGNSLNLACQDTIRDIKHMKFALDTTFERSKLLKFSAKKNISEFKLKLLLKNPVFELCAGQLGHDL